jgi:hypothetical protein
MALSAATWALPQLDVHAPVQRPALDRGAEGYGVACGCPLKADLRVLDAVGNEELTLPAESVSLAE